MDRMISKEQYIARVRRHLLAATWAAYADRLVMTEMAAKRLEIPAYVRSYNDRVYLLDGSRR